MQSIGPKLHFSGVLCCLVFSSALSNSLLQIIIKHQRLDVSNIFSQTLIRYNVVLSDSAHVSDFEDDTISNRNKIQVAYTE